MSNSGKKLNEMVEVDNPVKIVLDSFFAEIGSVPGKEDFLVILRKILLEKIERSEKELDLRQLKKLVFEIGDRALLYWFKKFRSEEDWVSYISKSPIPIHWSSMTCELKNIFIERHFNQAIKDVLDSVEPMYRNNLEQLRLADLIMMALRNMSYEEISNITIVQERILTTIGLFFKLKIGKELKSGDKEIHHIQ